MDIERLREFVEIARFKSFTKAAEFLGTSQPSLSRHLSALERELGVSLLQRDTHGVSLTPDGEAALERCRSIVGEYDLLFGGSARTLRVGAPIQSKLVNDVLLGAFLAARKFYPNTDIRFIRSFFDSCEKELSQGEFDLALTVPTRLPLAGIVHRYVLSLPIQTAYVNPANPLAKRAAVHMADLDGLTWRSGSRNQDRSWSISITEELFSQAGITLRVGKPIDDPFILAEDELLLSLLGLDPKRVERTMVGVPILDGPELPLDAYWRASDRDPLLETFLTELLAHVQ